MRFCSAGWAYGLLQADEIEPFLLQYFAVSSHAYTRGTWIAPETTNLDRSQPNAFFCTPASVTAALHLKWMLALEEPREHVLWLAKGLPRLWLAEGERVSAAQLPSAYGRIDLTLVSSIESKQEIAANVSVPSSGAATPGRGAPLGGLVLRLRAPTGWKMASAALSDGGAWAVDARAECVRFSQAQLRAAGTLAKMQGTHHGEIHQAAVTLAAPDAKKSVRVSRNLRPQ